MTDYPQSSEQFRFVVSCACPAICYITLEGALENERKGAAAPRDMTADYRTAFEKDLEFFAYNFGTAVLEEITQKMLNDLMSTDGGFLKCQKSFLDVRFVDIPKYPVVPLPMPQITPNRPPSKATTAASKAAQAALAQPPPPPIDLTSALTSAYKRAVLDGDQATRMRVTPICSQCGSLRTQVAFRSHKSLAS
jgi:hypothetical protein